jgi:hypothetical protein
LDQIVEETREMPGEVVAELIDRIMVARHGGIEPFVANPPSFGEVLRVLGEAEREINDI